MKKIFTLNTRFMNGTVTMSVDSTSFTTYELAEKAMKAVEEANSKENLGIFTIFQTIQESELYEEENEVPILNRDKEDE